jgi:phosphatidylglycerol:prolipoprotein diacylglycerol transferase
MYPEVGFVPAFLVGWSLAALLGGGGGVWLMRRAGLSTVKATLVVLGLIAAVVIGSKILYLLENASEVFAGRAALRAALYSARMRIPGGFALMVLVTPLLARVVGVRVLWLADAFIPAAALSIVGIRIGCFLEGCCFGRPSTVPWAVRFPAASSAFWWQVQEGLVTLDARSTVPVHPLQIYFGLAGLLIFLGLFAYQNRKRYDGEVLLLFGVSFLWSTWLLELLRANPHELTLHLVFVAALVVSAVTVGIEWRLRVRRQLAFKRPQVAL